MLPNTFANHAHNDILELWLETGLVGAVVAALCAVWILRHALRVWRAGSWGTRGVDLLLARAASLAIGLVIAHSLFDYPLRTSANMVLLAFCCALLTTPAGHAPTNDADTPGIDRHKPILGRAARVQPRHVPTTPGAGSAPHPSVGGERWGRGIKWPDAWQKPRSAPRAPSRSNVNDDEGQDD